jgi:methyl-accepting chemotaxis protein
MNALARLTVARRLTFGFGLVSALILAFAAMAWIQLQEINAAVSRVVDDRYPTIDVSRDIYDAVNVQARMLGSAIVTASLGRPSEVNGQLDKLDAAVSGNEARFDKLRALIGMDKGHELFKAMVELHADYARARADQARLLREGKWEDAARLSLGEARAKQELFFAKVEEMVVFQEDQMRTGGADAEKRIAHTIASTLGVASAVLVLSLLMAWAITRSVLTELGGEPAAARDEAQRIARGDLTRSITVAPRDTASLYAALGLMHGALVQTVASVRLGSESVASASAQIAQGNLDLSSRTEEQASALEQTAATMEQLNATARNNTDAAKQASQLAKGASTIAMQGGEVVGRVVTTMQGISDSSRKIGNIIGVIDGIAFQTNILALNAAVEAARAGEQGRGFAVVASEVRSLAQRSAEAAKEIKTLIGNSVQQVEQGTGLVDQAGKTMDEIVAAIQRVSDIVAEIASASVEQCSGISQVSDAVSQMDLVTQKNAALVEESAAAAESLKTQAQQLLQAVSLFKLANGAGAGHGPRH